MLQNYLSPQEYRQLQAARLEAKANPRAGAGQGEAVSLTAFKQAIYRRYIHAPHLELLDRHLEQVSRYAETRGKEGIGFLLVEMPPRHGKSLTVSQYYPVWHIGQHPEHRVMVVSYAAHLAQRFSRKARNTVLSPIYQKLFPSIQLAEDRRAADSWDIAGYDGGMDALGVLSGATGKGASVLVCDDLISGRQDAESQVIRDRTWDGVIDDLLTRLEPGGAAVFMATRWHLDDPTGRILAKFAPDSYVRLRLPALAEPNDLLGRAEGEALWPERYPRDVLLRIQERMGPYSWSSLYQQNPVPAEGGIFKRRWFTIVRPDSLPDMQRYACFWDLAMSSKTSADYTVGTLIGEGDDGHLYILNVWRGQIEWGDVTPYMAEVMIELGPIIPHGVEEKGFMSRAVTQLNMDGRLRSYQVWGYPKDTDKLTNALPFAAKCAAGVVHLKAGHWNETWLDEICSFTGSGDETDDQVDSVAGAFNMLTDGAGAEYGEVSYEDDTPLVAF